ncbi:nuclear protein MDM1 [Discoglossus pictus]
MSVDSSRSQPGKRGGGRGLRAEGVSEYDRNFKWKNSVGQLSRWAGLRSDELGITKEPSFPSKRRVPYYNPQISKSFQWEEDKESLDNGYTKYVEPVKLRLDLEKDSLDEEKTHTPDAPRSKKKYRSHSAGPRDGKSTPKKLSTLVTENYKEVPKPSKASPQKENKKSKENQFHRVLQKKAGLNIPPLHHPLRMSEYGRQFQRKSPAENSPLLDAEQIVYNKNKTVPPFKVKAANSETEYKSQFKGSPNAKGPKLRKDWEEKNVPVFEPQKPPPKRKEKKKKTPEVAVSFQTKECQDILQKEPMQRDMLKEKIIRQIKSSKGFRKVKSEYSANFLSPSSYKYKDGAWVRLTQQMQDQVNELREKAEYYRRREQGTHFSRDHLNQIISASNRLWDMSSTNSTTDDPVSNNIKALDLAGLQTSKKETIPKSCEESQAEVKAPSNTGHLGASNAPTIPVRRRLVWEENHATEPTREEGTQTSEAKNVKSVNYENREGLEEIEDLEENSEQEDEVVEEKKTKREDGSSLTPSIDGSECSSLSSEANGRLPTPQLKKIGQAQRTHHDLTTPATGGALLVSPTRNHSHTPEGKKYNLERHSSTKKAVPKEYLKRKLSKDEDQCLQSPPVAGIRTIDPLPLREDPWTDRHNPSKSSPAVMTNVPTRSPIQKPVTSMSQQWSPSSRIHGALRHPEFQHNGSFTQPGFYKTPLWDNDDEDDRLSQISARSAASSSLASQVLERAQKRKEHFWGKK